MKTDSKKIVVKFGGSNLKSKEDIVRLFKVISLYQRLQQSIVVVVSAFFGVTDMLLNALKRVKTNGQVIPKLKEDLYQLHYQIIQHYIEDFELREATLNRLNERIEELEKNLRGIHYLGEIPDFVNDRVLSYGERLSSLTLTALLNARKLNCRECLPEDLGLFTNGEYSNASIDFRLAEKAVKESLLGKYIYVIPGFYGVSKDLKVTLLGRGGTDYTAAAIARCIGAQSVDLWKDVAGFMSADPKMVEKPTAIRQLTYNEAAELSYFGARIIHPRTFEPVMEKRIPVRVFNILDFSEELIPETFIHENGFIHREVIKSVTFSDDFGMLKLHGAGVGIKPGILAEVTNQLSKKGINIKSVITSQTCINILLSREDIQKGMPLVKALGVGAIERISIMEKISLIAVVGEGILEKPGIAARVFGAVSKHYINICAISAGASNVTIYFIIDQRDREKALQSIHEEVFSYPQNNRDLKN